MTPDPIMNRILCWLGLHRWRDSYLAAKSLGRLYHCSICGKEKWKS